MPPREDKPAELLVIIPLKDWRCAVQDVELQARMTEEIARLFPRCPPARAEARERIRPAIDRILASWA